MLFRSKADAADTVPESRDTNNTAGRAISIGPDLTNSSLLAPLSTAAGSTVAVTDGVMNQGADGAGPSTSRFYLSTNITLDANDVPLAATRAVPSLAAGESSSGTTAVIIPAATVPGTYYLFAVADADGAVAETLEANNSRWRSIQVTAGP